MTTDNKRHVLILAMSVSEIVATLIADGNLTDHTKERLAYASNRIDEHIELVKTEIQGYGPTRREID